MFEYYLEDLAGTVFSSPNAITLATEKFNALGLDGWELVAIYGNVAFFKREVQ